MFADGSAEREPEVSSLGEQLVRAARQADIPQVKRLLKTNAINVDYTWPSPKIVAA